MAAPSDRPDRSMDLLNQVLAEPMDPDYRRVSARPGPVPRSRLLLLVVAIGCGMLFAAGSVQSTRGAPAAAVERQQLLDRIAAEEQRHDELHARIEQTAGEVGALRDAALGDDAQARALEREIEAAAEQAAARPVRGPGVVVVADDAPGSSGPSDGRLIDLDLQQLVNGMWTAGAEAIAINGHRLSPLTPIRNAGDAITVDYRSLSPPYTVEVVGDPRTLPARFAESIGGRWWDHVRQNYGVSMTTTSSDELELPADPTLRVRHARAREE
ncbi:DUF881 domain-containing protein [Desertihabitans brevis]|uniref:DUF881 domain-containing protein n=1 Tax=Desertihabitans brevis TaxID=2268447 RepID=A0A367YZH0_9ACTN|nr:DUF881 domain-containing protein [Desertihabitans brevis]RCK71305.1 DUF881 domain-containing protein [Desertihabitans brevis]